MRGLDFTYDGSMKLSFRFVFSVVSVPALLVLLESPAPAAQRSFTATLTKVTGCSLASPSGSAVIAIDDVSGAVTGTLTIADLDPGAVVSIAGIHNKNAGDNLVGAFDGVDTTSPNASHAVTTTLNAVALPKILAGDGAIIVKSPASGCAAGAIRGDLVAASSAADAGADAGEVVEPPQTDGGTSGDDGRPSAPVDAGNGATPDAKGSDDGGCSQTGGRAPSPGLPAFGLVLAALVMFERRHASRRST